MAHPFFYITAALAIVVPIALLVEHIKVKNEREKSLYGYYNEEEEEETPAPPAYSNRTQKYDVNNGQNGFLSRRKTQREIDLENREREQSNREREANDELKRIELEIREKQLKERNDKLMELQKTIEEQKKLLSKYSHSHS